MVMRRVLIKTRIKRARKQSAKPVPSKWLSTTSRRYRKSLRRRSLNCRPRRPNCLPPVLPAKPLRQSNPKAKPMHELRPPDTTFEDIVPFRCDRSHCSYLRHESCFWHVSALHLQTRYRTVLRFFICPSGTNIPRSLFGLPKLFIFLILLLCLLSYGSGSHVFHRLIRGRRSAFWWTKIICSMGGYVKHKINFSHQVLHYEWFMAMRRMNIADGVKYISLWRWIEFTF